MIFLYYLSYQAKQYSSWFWDVSLGLLPLVPTSIGNASALSLYNKNPLAQIPFLVKDEKQLRLVFQRLCISLPLLHRTLQLEASFHEHLEEQRRYIIQQFVYIKSFRRYYICCN